MKKYLAVTLLIFVSAIAFGQSNENEAAIFTLKYKNKPLATIQVPSGYKEETKSYVEGVKTILSYPDKSYIVLQIGGMMKLPLFSESDHPVSQWLELPDRIIKSGRVRDTELFWREENWYGLWPPKNIGFTNVPKDRLEVFEKCLKSFISGDQ